MHRFTAEAPFRNSSTVNLNVEIRYLGRHLSDKQIPLPFQLAFFKAKINLTIVIVSVYIDS